MNQQNELDRLFKELQNVQISPETKQRQLRLLHASNHTKVKSTKRIPWIPGIVSLAIMAVAILFYLTSITDSGENNTISAFSHIEPYRTVVAQTTDDTTFKASLPIRPEAREILLQDQIWKSLLASTLSSLTLDESINVNEAPLFDLGIYTEESSLTRFKVYEGDNAWIFKDMDTQLFYTSEIQTSKDFVNMMKNIFSN